MALVRIATPRNAPSATMRMMLIVALLIGASEGNYGNYDEPAETSSYGANCLALMDEYKQGLNRAVGAISTQITATERRLANGMSTVDACVAAVTELQNSLRIGDGAIRGLQGRVGGVSLNEYTERCGQVIQNFASDLGGSLIAATGILNEVSDWRGFCDRQLVQEMLRGLYTSVDNVRNLIGSLP